MALRLLTIATSLAVGLFYYTPTADGAALMDLDPPAADVLHYSEATCRFEDSLVIITETMNQLTIRLADFSESAHAPTEGADPSSSTSGSSSSSSMLSKWHKQLRSLQAKYRDSVKRLALNRTLGSDEGANTGSKGLVAAINDDEDSTDEEEEDEIDEDDDSNQVLPIEALERHRRNIKHAIEQMLADEVSTRGPEEASSTTTANLPDIEQLDSAAVDKLASKWHRQVQSCLAQYRALQQIISFEHFLKRAFEQLEAKLLADPLLQIQDRSISSISSTELTKQCWLKTLQARLCKVVRSLQQYYESSSNQRLLFCGFLMAISALVSFTLIRRARQLQLQQQSQPPRKC